MRYIYISIIVLNETQALKKIKQLKLLIYFPSKRTKIAEWDLFYKVLLLIVICTL